MCSACEGLIARLQAGMVEAPLQQLQAVAACHYCPISDHIQRWGDLPGNTLWHLPCACPGNAPLRFLSMQVAVP